MAKAIGLIGNFKGKVGNMVGYQIPDSNTGNTQGIRIYQPVVKNPKTSAQAEQRAKLAPINATYRALKSIIDRGNEGLPYGNKSRLAWLKQAFHAESMPWIEKGQVVGAVVGCQLSKGSLPNVSFTVGEDTFDIECASMTSATSIATVGALSTALKTDYPFLKDGDQVTIVMGITMGSTFGAKVVSILIDTTSAEAISGFIAATGKITLNPENFAGWGSVIISREGESGQHLRSTSSIVIESTAAAAAPYDAASKTAAVASYMASAAGSTDWAEESIQ